MHQYNCMKKKIMLLREVKKLGMTLNEDLYNLFIIGNPTQPVQYYMRKQSNKKTKAGTLPSPAFIFNYYFSFHFVFPLFDNLKPINTIQTSGDAK